MLFLIKKKKKRGKSKIKSENDKKPSSEKAAFQTGMQGE